ncbi:phosphohistidine phosphatase SixA [Alteromonas macleodii]|uniref:phosphohistidine phosphatase SixA n=1 Tax=Alteromonas macleodii TaxID=28108 RepID=UPI001E5216FB|nr:phosphohistidine phosphatase SixA [Alteromonas macleodii]
MSGQSSNDDIYLFIMRHGEAEAPRLDDKSRQLTPLGREQAKTAALWLKDQYCQKGIVDLALVSPYRRAKQTHDMVSLDIIANKVENNEDIVPEGSPRLVSDYIDGLLHAAVNSKKPIKELLVVSHMPLVSYLVDELCQSYTTSLFSTASIAVIKYSLKEHKGTLVTHYQGL